MYHQLYPDYSKIISPKSTENFEIIIENFIPHENDINLIFEVEDPGFLIDENKICLRCKKTGEILMSNTNAVKYYYYDFIKKSKGDILIIGLGIGICVLPLLNKETINSITVVELNQEIIQLFSNFSEKINIINDDAWIYHKKLDQKFDSILIDIWQDIDVFLEQKEEVIKKYSTHIKKDGEIFFWQDKILPLIMHKLN